jgi:PPOX class probable F420-dependent enzyme
MTADIDAATYVSFTTYKRNGDAVSMPVWIAPFEGGYAFTTDRETHKVKRLANNPAVALRPCNSRGKVKPDAVEHRGTAEVIEGDDARRVRSAIRRKYHIAYWLFVGPSELIAKVRRREADPTAIRITLHGD